MKKINIVLLDFQAEILMHSIELYIKDVNIKYNKNRNDRELESRYSLIAGTYESIMEQVGNSKRKANHTDSKVSKQSKNESEKIINFFK